VEVARAPADGDVAETSSVAESALRLAFTAGRKRRSTAAPPPPFLRIRMYARNPSAAAEMIALKT
jgi:hypothetical protein